MNEQNQSQQNDPQQPHGQNPAPQAPQSSQPQMPQPAQQAEAQGQTQARSQTQTQTQGRSRAPLIVTAVIGGVVLLGGVVTAGVAGVSAVLRSSDGADQQYTAQVDGVTELDIDISGAEFELRFTSDVSTGDGEVASLDVTGGDRKWEFERDGDTLKAKSRNTLFDWNFFGLREQQQVVLTLPASLRTEMLDADFDLSAGSLRAEGDFAEVDLDVSAGDAVIEGTAESVSASVSAGEATIDLADVSELEFDVSAGRLDADLSGSAPRSVVGSVSAGDAVLRLPDVAYDVRLSRSAGSIDSELRTDSSSRYRVNIDVSAGSVTLRPNSR